MANNKSIQILRGSRTSILNSKEQLEDGQPLYNYDDNYISIGYGKEKASKEPIAVKELHIDYNGDSNKLAPYDYFIKKNEDMQSLDIYSPNFRMDSTSVDIRYGYQPDDVHNGMVYRWLHTKGSTEYERQKIVIEGNKFSHTSSGVYSLTASSMNFCLSNSTKGGIFMGYDGSASGAHSFSAGRQTRSAGDYSIALGYGAWAKSESSVAVGNATSSGVHSVAIGNYARAVGDYSFAEGLGGTYERLDLDNNTITVQASSSGIASHTEGYQCSVNRATGEHYAQHAEGYQTIAYGDASHSEGYQTTVNGDYSHAQGYKSGVTKSGVASFAGGWKSFVKGTAAFAYGYRTTAGYDHQFVVGSLNDNKEDSLFEVGCGYVTEQETEYAVMQNAFLIQQAPTTKQLTTKIYGNLALYKTSDINGNWYANSLYIQADKTSLTGNVSIGTISTPQKLTVYGDIVASSGNVSSSPTKDGDVVRYQDVYHESTKTGVTTFVAPTGSVTIYAPTNTNYSTGISVIDSTGHCIWGHLYRHSILVADVNAYEPYGGRNSLIAYMSAITNSEQMPPLEKFKLDSGTYKGAAILYIDVSQMNSTSKKIRFRTVENYTGSQNEISNCNYQYYTYSIIGW